MQNDFGNMKLHLNFYYLNEKVTLLEHTLLFLEMNNLNDLTETQFNYGSQLQ